ncbi:MFS transporter [Bacillus thuringiensis]|nr:MFS transporter [Bacillus thuringiensis]
MKGKLQNIHPLGMTIIIGTLFARFATSMSIPFLAIYLTTVKGVSAGMTGAIIGTSALVGVFASFIGGNLSDRFGRKTIMLWSMIVWIFVFIGFSLADHVLSFFLLNALNGLCRSFFEPTSRALLSDLTKPEYKGTLVMPHPASSGTGFLTVSAWLQIMGEDKGWDYMKKLHDNMASYTHSGSKPAKLAGAGEYPVGVSMVYSALKEKQKGAPVEVVLPKEGLGWEVEANALIKKDNAKNDKLAQAFLDWAITDDVMKLYFEKNGFATIKNDYKLPEGFPKDVTEKLYKKNDFKWAAENRDKILEKWEKEFGQKAEPKK